MLIALLASRAVHPRKREFDWFIWIIRVIAFPSSMVNNGRYYVSKPSIVASAGAVTHWRFAVPIGFVIEANPTDAMRCE
jgi:hypothetical protein